MTERTWRFDSVGAGNAITVISETAEPTPGSHPSPPESVIAPALRYGWFDLVRQWNRAAKGWMRERFKSLDCNSFSFEDILHEFSAIIETTDSTETVQAGILRQARRLMPGYRVELIAGPGPSPDRGTVFQRDLEIGRAHV